MKKCPKCMATYSDELQFCTKCGTKLEAAPPIPHIVNTPPERPTSGESGQQKTNKWSIWKKILIGVVVVIAGILLYYNHLINSTTYLRLNPEAVVFPKVGGEMKVSVDYDGYVWDVKYAPDWVSVSESNDSFVVTCEKNTTGRNREDMITISSGKIIQHLRIGQYAYATVLKLSTYDVKAETAGGDMNINMETDGCDFDISCPEFCSVTCDDNKNIKLEVNSNSGTSRSGTLVIKDANLCATVSVYQKGKCSFCDGTGEIQCSACGGTGSFSSYGFYGTTTIQCMSCGGTGKVQCPVCQGNGEI